MQVGVGFGDNPDSFEAGVQAAKEAVAKAGRTEPCDMVLLFSTVSHNQEVLREAVVSVVGNGIKIYGGGAAGVITNETYGYAGDQVGVACMWMDGAKCDVLLDDGLLDGEEGVGMRLGQKLAEIGTTPESPIMLFYDSIDRTHGDVRLIMATWLLESLKKGLGYFPELTGAGMQGDHNCTPSGQFIGDGIGEHYAMAMAFSDDIQIDSVIMHGCHPSSQYFTVTKAEGPVILEINNVPAITFVDQLLDSAIPPEKYPFFLMFGINHGEKWGEYDENNYASRLCLGLDMERGGIVMFEPDMVEGTKFQLMFRAMDLEYMKPKIESLFEQLDGREPVFAMYIDCAGRCAGYGGVEVEDAVVLQETVNNRVPLLGLYTGVEIAPIGGRPRGLDWTGVFCLFSKKKPGQTAATATKKNVIDWESVEQTEEAHEVPLEAALRLSEKNAAKVLALDAQSIAIRQELEQKRRGFRLLAELSVSLRNTASYESVFIPVAKRINGALNMQKTAVLIPTGDGETYMPAVLQGYTTKEKAELAGLHIKIPEKMLDSDRIILVTAEDDINRLADIRTSLKLPYFISSPIILQNKVEAILITGRMVEQIPYMSRLGITDVETVQAISALLGSVLTHQRLEAAEERAHIMINAMPICCIFWDENGERTDCNEEALRLFGLDSKEEFLERFYTLAPTSQPDGQASEAALRKLVLNAFVAGTARFEWLFQTHNGVLIPSEVTLVRVPRGEDYIIAGYIRDMREQKAAMDEISKARDLAEENVRSKTEFIAAVSHEIRTPMNGIMAMARTAEELNVDTDKQVLIDQGVRSAKLLMNTIDSVLDYSKMETGQVTLNEKPFSVKDVAEDIIKVLADDAAEKHLQMRTEIAADVPAQVIGDEGRLNQAVFNLAANAVKFTDSGEIVICVKQEKLTEEGKIKIIFAVQDSGSGISQEEQENLFAPLTSRDTSYTRRQSGLGMGLTISRGIAELMQGEVTMESTVGKGSTFTLSVLLTQPDAIADKDEDDKERIKKTLSGMRILVAEDNLINQIIIKELLTKVGIEVTIANNGLEAIEVLKEKEFDLILMDIQMPEMDGLTATAQIRADGRYDKLPILAMTAHTSAEHREESRRCGMNEHLTKPVDVDELYEALCRNFASIN